MGRLGFILLFVVLALGCSRERATVPASHATPEPAPVDSADRPRGAGLPPAAPDSFASLPPTHLRIAEPAAGARVPPPDAAMGEPPPPEGAVDRLPADDALHAPVLRAGSRAALPPQAHGWVELDLLVDAQGEVADARFAGGSTDPATIAAAVQAARALHYAPARQGGRAVAVWCRQRFE